MGFLSPRDFRSRLFYALFPAAGRPGSRHPIFF